MENNNFLLVDGNLLLFQSFYASAATNNTIMTDKNGNVTNAVHVFFSTLFKVLKEIRPSYLFIAFDASSKTKRHESFADYKAGRAQAPQELYDQFDIVKNILTQAKIPWLEKNGDEADDLIATLCAHNKNTLNFIYSKDKDLLQLVNENTAILKKNSGAKAYTEPFELITLGNFFSLYGITPEQIPDFKGLAGDKSDNLRGINGIGDKGAIKLINDFGTLENIYENLDKLSATITKKLLADKDSGFMCKELAKLNKNVDINTNKEQYLITQINYEEGIKAFEFYNLNQNLSKFRDFFKSLAKK